MISEIIKAEVKLFYYTLFVKQQIEQTCLFFAVCKLPLTMHEHDIPLGNHALRTTYRLFRLLGISV